MKTLEPAGNVRGLVVLSVVLAVCAAPSFGIIYYNGSTNNITAPTGDYADSGWETQGHWGIGTGTAISSKHFITGKHFGPDTDEKWADARFVIGGDSYTCISHVDDDDSDLRIVTIQESFSSWAPLYTLPNEVTQELVVFGHGYTRGDEVTVDELKGWKWSDTEPETMRWGTNVVTDLATYKGGSELVLLKAAFDADSGHVNEAHLADHDSGGGVFIKDGDTWKLAAVSYAVDGPFKMLPGDANSFHAALFDRSGLYYYNEGVSSWVQYPDTGDDNPSSFYATRISSRFDDWINDQIPEPATLLLLAVGGALLLARRRRAV